MSGLLNAFMVAPAGPFDIVLETPGAAAFATSGAVLTPYPASIVAGEALSLLVITRFDVTPNTPSGWALQISTDGGVGTDGVDAGRVRGTWFTKIAAGSETGNLSVTLPTAYDGCRAQIFRASKTGGTWDFTGYSRATNTQDPWEIGFVGGARTVQPKDLVIGAACINGNVCVPNAAMVLVFDTGPAETMTVVANGSTTTGSDFAWGISSLGITTTDTVDGFSQEFSGTATANTPSGVGVFLRLRAA